MYCGLIETTNMSALPKELVPAETNSAGNQLLNPSVPTEFFSINGQVRAYGGIYGTTDDYKLKIFFTGVDEQIDIAGKFQYGATVSEDLNPGETYTITYVPGGSVSFTVTPDSAMGVWINEQNQTITTAYGDNTGPLLSLRIEYSTRDENGKALSEFVQAEKDDVVTDENGITTITIRAQRARCRQN